MQIPEDKQFIYGIDTDRVGNPHLVALPVRSLTRYQVRTADRAGGSLNYHTLHKLNEVCFTPQRAWQVYIASIATRIKQVEDELAKLNARLEAAGFAYVAWKRENPEQTGGGTLHGTDTESGTDSSALAGTHGAGGDMD